MCILWSQESLPRPNQSLRFSGTFSKYQNIFTKFHIAVTLFSQLAQCTGVQISQTFERKPRSMHTVISITTFIFLIVTFIPS